VTPRRIDPDPLASRVARAARRSGAVRTLILDLDGTLAPIAPTPRDARVPDETREALRRLLRRGWTSAIVSGRPASQVREMLPLRGLRVFGSHGLEGSWTGRGRTALDATRRRRLARLARAGAALADRFPGALVERKPAGVAFHDRNVSSRLLGQWRRQLRETLSGEDLTGLEVLPGRRVLEIRPTGVHKGTVVQAFVESRRLRTKDESLVAIGDDRTDEDLFRAIRGRGLSVKVGRAGSETAASIRLASPTAVGRFLSALATIEEVRAPR
jgi:trehalose 6-phosphate phosphatase